MLPEKAIFWLEKSCLFISDVHLGKVDHFRKNGIAIPSLAGLDNYSRLNKLIEKIQPNKVIFLGDLFHSEINKDWLRLKSFLASFPHVSFDLVLGNHDIIDKNVLNDLLETIHLETHVMEPFVLSHLPNPHPYYYTLCGHIHPSIHLKGKGRQSLRLACFYFTKTHGVLPAFGTFTGTFSIRPNDTDDIFIIANQRLIKY